MCISMRNLTDKSKHFFYSFGILLHLNKKNGIERCRFFRITINRCCLINKRKYDHPLHWTHRHSHVQVGVC